MDPLNRRKFLTRLGAAVGFGFSRSIGALSASPLVAPVAATAAVAAGTTAAASAMNSPYGAGIRAQVLEVIVRQAAAGAPWKEICKGPMNVNNISTSEVEDLLAERSKHDEMIRKGQMCLCQNCTTDRQRISEERASMLAQIKHRDESPCPCDTCFEEVQRLRLVALTKSRTDWFKREPVS